jgi:hypothetical protein
MIFHALVNFFKNSITYFTCTKLQNLVYHVLDLYILKLYYYLVLIGSNDISNQSETRNCKQLLINALKKLLDSKGGTQSFI